MIKGSVILNMTGDEFKELIEGRKKDGTIGTIPEMLDALKGTKEGEGTVKKEIDNKTAITYDKDGEGIRFGEKEEER